MANVQITWAAQAPNSLFSDADHWIIRESLDAGVNYTEIVADNIPAVDTSLSVVTTDGQKYYEIAAVDIDGDESSATSFQILASTIVPLPVASVSAVNV